MMEKKYLKVLTFGVSSSIRDALLQFLSPEQIIEESYDLDRIMSLELIPPPFAILCGPPPSEIPVIEIAQMLRMQFQKSPIHYVTTDRSNFERKTFKKNGFTDAFLYPIDLSELNTSLREELGKASKGEIRVFKAVKVVDVRAGTVLPFDTYVYLSMNKKHICFLEAGVELDQVRRDRLAKFDVSSLHIPAEQMKSFYDFTANQLRTLNDSTAISETEKKERMHTAIRDLMSGIFNDSTAEASTTHGKAVIENCQQIVKSYITNGSNPMGKWYERIACTTGGASNSYSHSGNVSTYSVLFAMALGIKDLEEIAVAAVLHDIGIAALPQELQIKPIEEYTVEEKKIYQTHPTLAIKFIQERKLILSKNVHKIIFQHHECFNGSGYPDGLAGDRIHLGAQILAIADEFDYLTTQREGKQCLTPAAALELIKSKTTVMSMTPYSPVLVSKLALLFVPELKQVA